MRLVTSAKYLIGLVAASTAAMVIGGSAFAAESPQSSLVSDNKPVVTVPELSGTPIRSSESINEKTNTVTEVSSTTVKSAGNASVTIDGANDKPSQTSVSKQTTGSDSATPATSEVAIIQPAKNVAVNSEATSASANSDTQSPKLVESVLAATVAPAQAGLASASAIHEASVPTVRTGEQLLNIQPVITAHPVMPADLASTLPSAPETNTAPVPVHSNGLLSAFGTGLVATLASSVDVPSNSVALVTSFSFPLALSLLALVMALAGFGLWIRRTGFVTAPRSDVAHQQQNFATPSFMGYVAAWLQGHNPFLMVSETKIFSVMFVTL